MLARIAVSILLLFAAGQARDDVATLKQKAEAASGGTRVRLYVEVAQRQLAAADGQFTAGAADDAQKQVADMMECAERATDAAVTSNKRLKDTEIDLRKLQRRTDELSHSVDFVDRPPLEAAVKRLEQMRQRLLDRMFGKDKEEKKK